MDLTNHYMRDRMPDQCVGALAASQFAIQCNCRGPQNGQPACPCMMRNVQVKDGRYVRIVDLGPAPKEAGNA